MEPLIIAAITIALTLFLAAGGIMWRQGKSEGKMCAEMKELKESFTAYAKKNDEVIIICTQEIGENTSDIAYLKGIKNGKQG